VINEQEYKKKELIITHTPSKEMHQKQKAHRGFTMYRIKPDFENSNLHNKPDFEKLSQ